MKQAIKELVAKQIKAKSDRKSNDYKTRTNADYQVKKNRMSYLLCMSLILF